MALPGRNKDIMLRAIKTVQLFSERTLTAHQLAVELDISDSVARKWINAASRAMPIAELERVRQGERGPKAIVYGIIE